MQFRRATPHENGILCKTHKSYLLTCEELDDLWARSRGVCEACGFQPKHPWRDLVIDHDHHYGEGAVRGLVCRWCNSHLGQLENPDIHPTFGHGPGRWFAGYLSRAWFVRHRKGLLKVDLMVDREQLREEMREWRTFNKALFNTDPRALMIPLDKPADAARALREAMSHQAFGALAREIKRLAERPKRAEQRRPNGEAVAAIEFQPTCDDRDPAD